jgi:hypothetical protein
MALPETRLKELSDFLLNLNNDDVWALYGLIEESLKKAGKIRSNNLTCERGEGLAIEIYRKIPGEIKLQLAPPGTKNVDAISREGKTYSIKTVKSSKVTGTFQADDFTDKTFDYLIVVFLDEYYQPLQILEAPWEVVNKFKKYHKTMKAYNVSLSKKFKDQCRVVYSKTG